MQRRRKGVPENAERPGGGSSMPRGGKLSLRGTLQRRMRCRTWPEGKLRNEQRALQAG